MFQDMFKFNSVLIYSHYSILTNNNSIYMTKTRKFKRLFKPYKVTKISVQCPKDW